MMVQAMALQICTKRFVGISVVVICLLTLVHLLGLTKYPGVDRLTIRPVTLPVPVVELTNVTRKSSFNSTTLMHQDMCLGVEPLLAVIAVISSTINSQQRTVNRNTWGTVSRRDDVVLVFMLGQTKDATVQKKIEEEDAIYGDIVQGDFLDSYYNLTLKSIWMLHWVDTYCPNAQFMLKIDDDVFLHVPNFLSFLQGRNRSDSAAVIFGRLAKGFQPVRAERSKWFISEQEYGPSVYPDFIHGPSYVYTREAVPLILTAVAQLTETGSVIHLEDVFMNGICAEKANVSLVHYKDISIMGLDNACTARHSITVHYILSETMYFLWWFIHDPHFEDCQKLVNVTAIPFSNILRGQSYSLS